MPNWAVKNFPPCLGTSCNQRRFLQFGPFLRGFQHVLVCAVSAEQITERALKLQIFAGTVFGYSLVLSRSLVHCSILIICCVVSGFLYLPKSFIHSSFWALAVGLEWSFHLSLSLPLQKCNTFPESHSACMLSSKSFS